MKLLKKELKLAMHPTAVIFLLLSAMMIIPNYPYYVVFFYMSLAVYFTCLSGRENNDVFYTVTLPIAKRKAVKGRFCLVVLLELFQMLLCVPFAFLRQRLIPAGNAVGMDANISLFALALPMLGLFNYIFFTVYYKNVAKVGKAFLNATVVLFLYICLAEAATHIIPFFRDRLDTPDPMYLSAKLVLLFAGLILYLLLTLLAYKRSAVSFEKLDL